MIYLFATQFQSDVNIQLLETPYNADLQIPIWYRFEVVLQTTHLQNLTNSISDYKINKSTVFGQDISRVPDLKQTIALALRQILQEQIGPFARPQVYIEHSLGDKPFAARRADVRPFPVWLLMWMTKLDLCENAFMQY
jgi:hypothetical protein